MKKSLIAALAVALGACHEERTCPLGWALCDGGCAELEIDLRNCGACGVACGANEECDAGVCICGPGTSVCGDACVDLATSPEHCGACEIDCAAALDGPKCATLSGATSCTAACPAPLTDCDGACVDLRTDRWSCGACGRACQRGESCREGACRPDVYVACFATDDVRPANAALRAGLARKAGDGPIALATSGGRAFVANSLSHSLTSYALDLRDGREILLEGSDLQGLAVHGGRLFVSNSGPGTLVVYDPVAGRVVDEVVLGDRSGVNPHGVAFVGDRAYVALYGSNAESGGQEVVAVDLSGLDACAAPPCATVGRRIPLLEGADAGGLPFPSEVVAHGTTVYVVLANLKLGSSGFYTDPAGNGKLAVIDTATDDAVEYLDLGSGCTNPGALALDGDDLWISCGGTGNLLRVDLVTARPAGDPLPVPGLPAGTFFGPGKLAFCGGSGYVTDQWSGTVVRFDPSGVEAAASAVLCPTSDAGWAWAADVECAP